MDDGIFAPVTPGEILQEEFLKGYSLSQSQLARAIGVSPNRIAGIVNSRRGISGGHGAAPVAVLWQFAEFWLNLQTGYALKMARRRLPKEEAESIERAATG